MITQQSLLDKWEKDLEKDDWGLNDLINGRMPTEEKNTIFRKYPWIERIFNSRPTTVRIYISPISLDLLRISPARHSNGSTKEDIYFIDKQGNVLYYEYEALFGRFLFWKKQPVMRMVFRLPDSMNVRCMLANLALEGDAVKVKYVISYSKTTLALIIYEPPEDFSVTEWLSMLQKESGAELRAAVRALDETIRKYQ